MRQEADGPQAAQLESVPCGQMLQDEEGEELSPAQIRDYIVLILEAKETYFSYFSFLRPRRPSRLYMRKKSFLEVKNGAMSTYP